MPGSSKKTGNAPVKNRASDDKVQTLITSLAALMKQHPSCRAIDGMPVELPAAVDSSTGKGPEARSLSPVARRALQNDMEQSALRRATAC